jgi:hypothetical protein
MNYKRPITIAIFALPAAGLILSVLLFLPAAREEIIRFVERNIVHRSLHASSWYAMMITLSYIGIVSSLSFIVIIYGFFDNIYNLITSLFTRDWVFQFKQLWNAIPLLYKKSFGIIFLGLNIVFALHTASFIWSNHDWTYLFLGTAKPFSEGHIMQGRYFNELFGFIFTGGIFLPVFTNLIRFFFFSWAAVLLCHYWKLPKSLLLYSVTGLLFVLQPYTISYLFFVGEVPAFMQLGFFVLLGFIFGDKVLGTDSKKEKAGYILFSALWFWFAIGVYPVVVSTIAVIFIGKIIVDFISNKNQDKNTIRIIPQHIWTIVSIIIAVCFHLTAISLLKETGVYEVNYNTTTLALHDIPFRIFSTLKASFTYLLSYRQPFFPESFTLVFTALFLTSLSAVGTGILRSRKPLKIRIFNVVLSLILFCAVLFFSFISNLITTADTLFQSRIDFFGIAYFHILIVITLFQHNFKFIRNISLLACILLIHISGISDFYAMKVWKLGFEAEKMEWNRIIARIETTPGFQNDRDYRVIVLGTTRAYRPYFYSGESYAAGDLLTDSYMAGWGTSQILMFYTFTSHSKDGAWSQVLTRDSPPGEIKDIISEIPREIEKVQVWPSTDSIIIKDDLILIVLDKTELDKVRNLL